MRERRRGEDLVAAILTAAWAELTAHGYARLTMEAVAARAGTSRPVLSRRWSGRAELALAAIRQELTRHPLDTPPASNLRDELLQFLNQSAARASAISINILVIFGEYSVATGSSPQTFRTQLITHESDAFAAILTRAVARGEIAAERLKPVVSTLLIDLFRHHVMMNLSAPSPDLIRAWVDDIFLPLVRTSES